MAHLNKRAVFLGRRANGRRPSNYPIDGSGMALRITRMFDLKLRETNAGTLAYGRRAREAPCVNEMLNLLECFERHEFDRKPCENFVKQLGDCHDRSVEASNKRRAALRELSKKSGTNS